MDISEKKIWKNESRHCINSVDKVLSSSEDETTTQRVCFRHIQCTMCHIPHIQFLVHQVFPRNFWNKHMKKFNNNGGGREIAMKMLNVECGGMCKIKFLQILFYAQQCVWFYACRNQKFLRWCQLLLCGNFDRFLIKFFSCEINSHKILEKFHLNSCHIHHDIILKSLSNNNDRENYMWVRMEEGEKISRRAHD